MQHENLELVQGSPEWLAMRKQKVGASDAPIILGLSPWKTPRELMLEKLGSQTTPPNEHMERGTLLEESARREFERTTGMIMFPQVLFDKEFSWLMASLDGLSLERDKALEIKVPSFTTHSKVKKGECPEIYYPQVQVQMRVAQINEIYFYSYFVAKIGEKKWKLLDTAYVTVKRDDEYINWMMPQLKQFYEWMEQKVLPPENQKDMEKKEALRGWEKYEIA